MSESQEVKFERHRGDVLFRVVSGLFMLILAGLTWWMSSINAKAERVPVIEERVNNIQCSLNKIELGVEKLLERKGLRQ